jgi:hypothetical protein
MYGGKENDKKGKSKERNPKTKGNGNKKANDQIWHY